jgi:hypothetical protein
VLAGYTLTEHCHAMPHVSRIAPAFTSHNVVSLAPLTFIGLGGVAMAWIILNGFSGCPTDSGAVYSPLVVGEISVTYMRASYQSISLQTQQNLHSATVIAMGITASSPFGGVDDEILAIVYISMFILILIFLVRFLSLTHVIHRADAFKITLFPLGGYLLISKDFFEGPDVDSEEVRERMHLRRRRLTAKATCLSCLFRHSHRACDTEAGNLNDVQDKDSTSHNGNMRSESIISHKTLTSTPPSTTSDEDIETHGHAAEHHVPHANFTLACDTSRPRLLKPIPIVIAVSVVTAFVDSLLLPPSGGFQPRFWRDDRLPLSSTTRLTPLAWLAPRSA